MNLLKVTNLICMWQLKLKTSYSKAFKTSQTADESPGFDILPNKNTSREQNLLSLFSTF